jgi:hypothetical protein
LTETGATAAAETWFEKSQINPDKNCSAILNPIKPEREPGLLQTLRVALQPQVTEVASGNG